MISLEERWIRSDIEKAQYLKRVGVPGHYRYYYNLPKKREQREHYKDFGKEIRHKGDYKETFKNILKEKGYAKDVFKTLLPILDKTEKGKRFIPKDKNGRQQVQKTGIDILYGNSNFGLRHILEKHYAEFNDYESISELTDAIIDSFKELGENSDKIRRTGSTKFEFTDSKGNSLNFDMKISKDSKGEEIVSHFVLTEYNTYKMKIGGIKKRGDSEYEKKMEEIINYK